MAARQFPCVEIARQSSIKRAVVLVEFPYLFQSIIFNPSQDTSYSASNPQQYLPLKTAEAKMQLTSSLVSLLLAAATTGVQALPGSSVEQRQDAPRIYAKFWSDTACGADGGDWVEDTVWLQEPVGQCLDNNVWTIFGSTEIVTNLATHDRMAKPQVTRIKVPTDPLTHCFSPSPCILSR